MDDERTTELTLPIDVHGYPGADRLSRRGPIIYAVKCTWQGRPSILGVAGGVLVVANDRADVGGTLGATGGVQSSKDPTSVTFLLQGKVTVQFSNAVAAGQVLERLADLRQQLRLEAGHAMTRPAVSPVLVVTMNDIPGYNIIEVVGDVFGLTVRARNYFSNLGASFRTISGGEVGGYTKLLSETRLEARARLIDEARSRGANAVVAMRFDANEIGDIMTEVVAYGTAVIATKISTPPSAPGPL